MFIQNPQNVKKEKSKIDEKWKALYKVAQQKNPNLKEPTVPYSDSHIVG